jgi:hypothetical protein
MEERSKIIIKINKIIIIRKINKKRRIIIILKKGVK